MEQNSKLNCLNIAKSKAIFNKIVFKSYFCLLQSLNEWLRSQRKAPVAQLDRVLDYESRGRGFESSPVRHFHPVF